MKMQERAHLHGSVAVVRHTQLDAVPALVYRDLLLLGYDRAGCVRALVEGCVDDGEEVVRRDGKKGSVERLF